MMMSAKVLFVASAAALATLAACGSDNLAPACAISGVYKLHYDLVGGSSANCKPINDSTYDSANLDGGIPSCAVVRDNNACTITLACNYVVLGFNVAISGNAKFSATAGTGTAEVKTTKVADNSLVSDCNYNMTYTH